MVPPPSPPALPPAPIVTVTSPVKVTVERILSPLPPPPPPYPLAFTPVPPPPPAPMHVTTNELQLEGLVKVPEAVNDCDPCEQEPPPPVAAVHWYVPSPKYKHPVPLIFIPEDDKTLKVLMDVKLPWEAVSRYAVVILPPATVKLEPPTEKALPWIVTVDWKVVWFATAPPVKLADRPVRCEPSPKKEFAVTESPETKRPPPLPVIVRLEVMVPPLKELPLADVQVPPVVTPLAQAPRFR